MSLDLRFQTPRRRNRRVLGDGSALCGHPRPDYAGQTAELCRLGPGQASRLLKRLVVRQELRIHGTRRGAGIRV